MLRRGSQFSSGAVDACDEDREAAKRERLEIEKSTGKGDCCDASLVITLLQALWHLETLSHRAWIITHRDRLSSASKSIPPSEHGPNLKSQLHSHCIDFHLLYPRPLYHYQATPVTTLVLPQPSSHPPNAQATSAIRHLATGLQPPTFNHPTGRFPGRPK